MLAVSASFTGFQVVTRAFDGESLLKALEDWQLSPTVLVLAEAKLGSVGEADSSLLGGEWVAGSWSDGPMLKGGGAATSSYLDAEER